MYVMLLVVNTKRFRPKEWEHCTGILIKTNTVNAMFTTYHDNEG